MVRVYLATAVVVVAGLSCSKQKPESPTPVVPPPGAPGAPPAAPPPAPPPRGTPETVRMGPSALRYMSHQVIHIEQEFQGMRQPIDFGLRVFFRVTIAGPADSTGYPTTVTIDSIIPDSGSTVPGGTNLGAAKNLSFAGRLAPTGEFRNPVPSDSTAAQALGSFVGSFRNLFPRLPATGATVGSTWTDTVTTSDRSNGSVVVKAINQGHAAAWEERNGARSMRIEITSNFTIQGAGAQGGQPFEVVGNGVRSGVDYIAVDGRYMGGEARDSTSMTITLPVQAMTIPRTQVSRSTVTVLP